MSFCGLTKGISPKICILCVRVIINKRFVLFFNPFVFGYCIRDLSSFDEVFLVLYLSLSKELVAFLKERKSSSLSEMEESAKLNREAHPGRNITKGNYEFHPVCSLQENDPHNRRYYFNFFIAHALCCQIKIAFFLTVYVFRSYYSSVGLVTDRLLLIFICYCRQHKSIHCTFSGAFFFPFFLLFI